jgi:hypothetical protein
MKYEEELIRTKFRPLNSKAALAQTFNTQGMLNRNHDGNAGDSPGIEKYEKPKEALPKSRKIYDRRPRTSKMRLSILKCTTV